MSSLPPSELSIDAHTLQQIYRQAEHEFPRECCGYLQRRVDGSWLRTPCVNRQDKLHQLDPERYPRDATSAYEISGAELLAMVRSFEGSQPVRIIYHSHPVGGAYFSQTDRQGAIASAYPVDYLVVDVANGQAKEARLFAAPAREAAFEELARYNAQGQRFGASEGDSKPE